MKTSTGKVEHYKKREPLQEQIQVKDSPHNGINFTLIESERFYIQTSRSDLWRSSQRTGMKNLDNKRVTCGVSSKLACNVGCSCEYISHLSFVTRIGDRKL